MSRDPYAKALRVKPQQVIPDKRNKHRGSTFDDFCREIGGLYPLDEEIPEDLKRLLDDLD